MSDDLFLLFLRGIRLLQAIANVLRNGHPGENRVTLENHRPGWIRFMHRGAANLYSATAWRHQTGDNEYQS